MQTNPPPRRIVTSKIDCWNVTYKPSTRQIAHVRSTTLRTNTKEEIIPPTTIKTERQVVPPQRSRSAISSIPKQTSKRNYELLCESIRARKTASLNTHLPWTHRSNASNSQPTSPKQRTSKKQQLVKQQRSASPLSDTYLPWTHTNSNPPSNTNSRHVSPTRAHNNATTTNRLLSSHRPANVKTKFGSSSSSLVGDTSKKNVFSLTRQKEIALNQLRQAAEAKAQRILSQSK
eukprot:PhF_6_TR19733/c0_g1_i2/m.28798